MDVFESGTIFYESGRKRDVLVEILEPDETHMDSVAIFLAVASGTALWINKTGIVVASILTALLGLRYYAQPFYWRRRAARFLKLNRTNEASVAFRKALGVSPRDARLWFGLGATLHRLGRLDEALDALKRAGALETRQAKIDLELAQVLCELRKYDDALAAVERAVQSDETPVRAILTRCSIEIDAQLFDKAEKDGDWLIALGNESIDSHAYNLRGVARLMQGRSQEAQADFETSYLIDPQSVSTRVCCAAAWYRRNMYEKTILLCNSILKIDATNALAFRYRGLSRRAMGMLAEADADLKQSEVLKRQTSVSTIGLM